MLTYTFIIEYDGGTYIGQGIGENLSAACKSWGERFRSEGGMGRRTAAFVKAVNRAVSEGGVVGLAGLENTWCFSGLFAGRLLLGNVVLTVRSSNSEFANLGSCEFGVKS